MGSELFEDKLNPDKLSSVKLVRGQKGAYGWEIKVYDDNPHIAYEKCESINLLMESLYGKDSEETDA